MVVVQFLLLCVLLLGCAAAPWKDGLVAAGLEAEAADKLIAAGLSTADLFLHACPKEEDLESFLVFLLVTQAIVTGRGEGRIRGLLCTLRVDFQA